MESSHTKRPSVTEVTVKADHAGQRLDNFLNSHFRKVPKGRIYRAIRKGEVRINKKRCKAHSRLEIGDIVRLPPLQAVVDHCSEQFHEQLIESLLGERRVFEDEHLLVLNKPSGLSVHKGTNVPFGVIDILKQHYQDGSIFLVHRLDKATSGCLLIAKTRAMLLACHEQFRTGRAKKSYLALLNGKLQESEVTVDAALTKQRPNQGEHVIEHDEAGKASVTDFKVIERFADCTFVEAKPKTGRMHQIRVHAAMLGHPIIGDTKYTKSSDMGVTQRLNCKRLFLHARSISLTLLNDTQPATLASG